MGWSKGAPIFGSVYDACIERNVGEKDMYLILYKLAKELFSYDWDTEYYFLDDPLCVRIFNELRLDNMS